MLRRVVYAHRIAAHAAELELVSREHAAGAFGVAQADLAVAQVGGLRGSEGLEAEVPPALARGQDHLLRHDPVGAQVAGPGEPALLDFVGGTFRHADDYTIGGRFQHAELRHRGPLQIEDQARVGDVLGMVVDDLDHASGQQDERFPRAVHAPALQSEVLGVFDQDAHRLGNRRRVAGIGNEPGPPQGLFHAELVYAGQELDDDRLLRGPFARGLERFRMSSRGDDHAVAGRQTQGIHFGQRLPGLADRSACLAVVALGRIDEIRGITRRREQFVRGRIERGRLVGRVGVARAGRGRHGANGQQGEDEGNTNGAKSEAGFHGSDGGTRAGSHVLVAYLTADFPGLRARQ